MRIGCVATLTDVAKAFDVSYRVVKEWPKRENFPREADGSYHLVRIAVWRERTFEQIGRRADPEDEEQATSRAEAARRREWALAEQEELELARQRGTLIEVDAIARLFERSIAEHNTLLDQLKDRILQLLPSKMKPADRKRLLAGIDKATDDLRRLMAAAADEWAKEAETEETE